MSNTNKELQLLINTINNGSESEADGVKYIYMDENTIYRFENNRMKKVSNAMIKKANKIISTEQKKQELANIENDNDDEEEIIKTKVNKRKKVIKQQELSDEDENEDDEAELIKTKVNKKLKKSGIKTDNIDLNEYWQTKTKLEYQEKELERLNNKVNKLRQYKSIVSKITGGEYDNNDNYYQSSQSTQQQLLSQPKKYNDSLFMFN